MKNTVYAVDDLSTTNKETIQILTDLVAATSKLVLRLCDGRPPKSASLAERAALKRLLPRLGFNPTEELINSILVREVALGLHVSAPLKEEQPWGAPHKGARLLHLFGERKDSSATMNKSVIGIRRRSADGWFEVCKGRMDYGYRMSNSFHGDRSILQWR